MKFNELRSYFLLALIVLALVLCAFIFAPFAAPLLTAVVFAVVLAPVQSFFVRRFGGRESLAALASVCAALVGILLPLSLIGALVVFEAQQLYASLSAGEGGIVAQASAGLNGALAAYVPDTFLFDAAQLSASAGAYLEQGLKWIIGQSANIATGAAGVVFSFLLFFISLFYLLRDGAFFKRTIISLSPLSETDDEILFVRLERSINSVVKGNLAVALIQGVVASIGLSIFGVPNSILWGLAVAFAALIPGVGTSLIMFPAVIYTFFSNGTIAGIGLLAWAVLAVGLVDNFLGPRLIGGGMKLHPLLVLFSVLGGVSLFGPVGIFLGPLSLALLAALISVYLEREPETLA